MVQRGLDYARHTFDIRLHAASILIPMDGDCLFSSVAYAGDSRLSGRFLQTAATTMRQVAVRQAIIWIEEMDKESFQGLQAVAAAGNNMDREGLKLAMEQYMENGQYEGNFWVTLCPKLFPPTWVGPC